MASTIRVAATQHWAGKAPSLSKGKWLKRALGAAQNRDRSSHYPINPGAVLFGQVVEKKRRHTVASLATSMGVHPKTVANILSQSGMLPKDVFQADSRRTVEAEPAEELIAKLKRAIPVAKIPERIGCTRPQVALLLEKGFLRTVVEDGENLSLIHI